MTPPPLETACVELNEGKTQLLGEQLLQALKEAPDAYIAAKTVAKKYLGAHVIEPALGTVQFGFWMPGLKQGKQLASFKKIVLEIFCLPEGFEYQALKTQPEQKYPLQRHELPLTPVDDFLVGVVSGLPIGTRDLVGALYWLRCVDANGASHLVRDPLTQSVPFGIYGPAEIVDLATMFAQRKDKDYFSQHFKARYPDGSYRAHDIGITLEVHPETATEQGTIQALTATYQTIAQKVSEAIAEEPSHPDPYRRLTPVERNFVGFDTLELTPEVPPAEREAQLNSRISEFFDITDSELNNRKNIVNVTLRKPNISDWGYDTPIIGTGSVNPSILATGRPHEFLELIETLHTFPGTPIQISLDAVLGHADFQGALLLQTFDSALNSGLQSASLYHLKYHHSAYFRGSNLYGRDINYSHPVVRAILLEMYTRKLQFGFDCVRVDGGQDFIQSVDPNTGYRVQDDAFIHEMVSTTVTIHGVQRRLDMNVEDGRPWPNDMNWLYNATYLEHVLSQSLPYGDQVKQWGSLIFAHNVHGKFKWFQTKWDRFKDTFKDGEVWITGHSNHDNARYYYRLVTPVSGNSYQPGDSFDDYYNEQYVPTLKETTHRTLDHTGLSALVLAFLPGNPMFFLNALFHAPWLFFRDIDDRYGLKVVADEGSRFLTCYMDAETYEQPHHFKRLKALGFQTLSQLVTPVSSTASNTGKGFMDILFDKHEKIKTDPVAILGLFEDPSQQGRFDSVEELGQHFKTLTSPQTAFQKNHQALLLSQIEHDPLEAERKRTFTRQFLQKYKAQLERTLKGATTTAQQSSLALQQQKIAFLETLFQQGNEQALQLLIQDTYQENSYDISTWGQDTELIRLAPPELLKEAPVLTELMLKAFALAFMLDARDVAKLHYWHATIDSRQTAYNLALRQFRKKHGWLTQNPTNDPRRDFFNRKIIPNGAKDLGAFFSDKGDVINANTVYYGWRTAPEDGVATSTQKRQKQIFFLANMEGKPLFSVAMSQFLPMSSHSLPQEEWRVAVKSPSLDYDAPTVTATTVLPRFSVGDTLILERTVTL